MTKKFFFIVNHIKTIKNPKLSSKSNIGKDDSAWQQNEKFRCAKNIRRNDLSEAGIILDVTNQKVIKNRYGNQNFTELYQHFVENYGDYINEWLKNQLVF